MKTIDAVVLIFVSVLAHALMARGGEIQPLSAEAAAKALPELAKVGFEEFRMEDLYPLPPARDPGLANPLRYPGLSILNPGPLSGGFCSAPTCLPDLENEFGGNVSLFLIGGASLSFDALPRTVVLDVQGIGDNPFTLDVIDGSGAREHYGGVGIPFGRFLAGFSADAGVARVEVDRVSGTGGPLALAGVFFTVPEPDAPTLILVGGLLLAASALARHRSANCGAPPQLR